MQSIIKIHGVNVTNANGLPTVPWVPENEFASGLEWVSFIQPEDATDINVTDLANDGEPLIWYQGPEFGVMPNGRPAFGAHGPDPENVNPTRINFVPDINVNEWSMFSVIFPQVSDAGAGSSYIVRQDESNIPEEDVGICFYYTRTSLTSFGIARAPWTSSAFDLRLTAPLGDRATPSLLMATFSTDRGLALYDNGVLVESAPEDKRPLTETGNPCSYFHQTRGFFGSTGIVNNDLSRPELAGNRRAIERFLMDKYGIPEGPQ